MSKTLPSGRSLLLSSVLAAGLLAACGGNEPESDTGSVTFAFDHQRLSELGLLSVRVTVVDGNAAAIDCNTILQDPEAIIPRLMIIAESREDVDPFAESHVLEIAEIPQGTIGIAVAGYQEASGNQDTITAIGCNVATIEGGKRTVVPVRLFDRSE